jgi:hypothetical protein
MNMYQILEEELKQKNVWDDIASEDQIKYYYIDPKPNELRFVLRDGKRILQQELAVTVHFKVMIYYNQDMIDENLRYVWFDIPMLEDE